MALDIPIKVMNLEEAQKAAKEIKPDDKGILVYKLIF